MIVFVQAANVTLIPDIGRERVALVLQCQGVTSLVDLRIHELVRHAQRPDPIVDGTRHFLNGAAIGIDGIPHPNEMNAVYRDRSGRADRLSAKPAPKPDHAIPHLAHVDLEVFQERDDTARESASVKAVCICRKGGERSFVILVSNKPLARDQPGDNAYGESAPTEAETVDAISGLIIPATEAIDIDHVALQPEAEHLAKDCKWFEGRGAYAVVVIGDLATRIAQIQHLK